MPPKNGFTLVELAIALMIIGLLIGGVLKGQELIENAKVTATIRAFKAYDAATLIFRNTYGKLPGDMKNPTTRLSNCTVWLCNTSGDGDNSIGPMNTGGLYAMRSEAPPFEYRTYWRQLSAAGLISGFGANDTTVDAIEPPVGGYFDIGRFEIPYAVPNMSGHYYIITGQYALLAQAPWAISPKHGYQMDQKLDDGSVNHGDIMGAGDACQKPMTPDYEATLSSKECNMVIKSTF